MIIERILYVKLCYDRAYDHINIPISIFDKLIMLSIFLKVFEIENYWVLALVGLVGIASMILLGHIDLKLGILSKETSIRNRYNPEIQRLLKK